jgi:hypothetical protein
VPGIGRPPKSCCHSLKVIEDAADEGIHCDERWLRSKIVESPMKGFLIEVCDFLEKFGVKLFAIRYVLHQHLTTRNVALVEERRCKSA